MYNYYVCFDKSFFSIVNIFIDLNTAPIFPVDETVTGSSCIYLLHIVQNVQVCDASKVYARTDARFITILLQ